MYNIYIEKYLAKRMDIRYRKLLFEIEPSSKVNFVREKNNIFDVFYYFSFRYLSMVFSLTLM